MKRALLPVLLLFALLGSAADVNISGSWSFAVVTDAGSGSPSFTFSQTGGKLTGKYSGMFGESDVAGEITGNAIQFSFKVSQDGQTGTIQYQGTIESATEMKGKVTMPGVGEGTWTAKKK